MTEWVYCIQEQHRVKAEDMTTIPLASGGRRRVCKSCKEKWVARRRVEQGKRDLNRKGREGC